MTLSMIARLEPTQILAAIGLLAILVSQIYRRSLIKQGKL